MNDLVLDQLLEADSGLASQAATLEAQLAAIQEKREGLQTVIVMFQSPSEEPSTGGVETNGAAVETNGQTNLTEPVEVSSADEAEAAKTISEPESAPSRATKKPRKAKRGTRSVTKKTKTKKRDGRAASWQRYIKDSFQKEPLPEVISGVLRNQPNHVFLIAEVMNAVFEEDMPKSSFLKARNRVSNILSGGARDGSWYRGRNGRYSMSENVVKAS
ncbi:hypothetical protein IQ241_02705 [Romeria aff. gracilis LEGE 07310]|uniref:Uncharacterized protein n=1 Tax=Vasconcelosia minhoensis LEGE 07310 TaxID=915328 RepID=A0A8J7AIV4_9CYAN|nr:hypothetical protein [Romeria gracilis]MBE9076215.1 hypothetical protein [Romeria aff. gracilis LEGE 07310]